MDKLIYTVIHEHRVGDSTYTVRSDHFPTEEEVIDHCNIDFEPMRGETISISELISDDIIEIPSVK